MKCDLGRKMRLRIFFLLSILFFSSCSSYPLRLEMIPAPVAFQTGDIDPFKDLAPQQKSNVAEIFYATDRAPSKDMAKEPFYTSEPQQVLRVGKAKVRIGKGDTTWDEIVRDTIKENKAYKLSTQVMSVDDFGILPQTLAWISPDYGTVGVQGPGEKFAEAINAKLKTSRYKNIYLYVPGYRIGFEDPVQIASQLWYYMGYDGVFIAYSWPATAGKTLAYLKDIENANNTIRKFRVLLEFLAEKTDAQSINMIGYSAGSRVVAGALHELRMQYPGSKKEELLKKLKIRQVMLIAGDIDRNLFGSYFLDRFLDLSENMTVYISRTDKALRMSEWQLGKRRLGEYKELHLSSDLENYLKNKDDLVVVNVSDAQDAKVDYGHGYFLKSPWISTDVLVTFKFGVKPSDRGLAHEKETPFWKFSSDYDQRIEGIIRAH